MYRGVYRDNWGSATSSYGGCHCDNGISDAAALAAGAVAGFLLYQAITMAAAGRRKRSESTPLNLLEVAKDLLFAGNYRILRSYVGSAHMGLHHPTGPSALVC